MLGADGAELRLILELVEILERTREAELLLQAACHGIRHGFAAARMRAAGIRPVPRPEHLALAALLQQQLVVAIEDEDRERTVQRALARMAIGLALEADLAIMVVDENQLLACVRDDLFTRHSNRLRDGRSWPGTRRPGSR